ncbi:ribosome maturation factor RimP [Nitratireductor sp. CAU 1489]|uniref:Ribosome maturation factor RimP n=1 Tax=Nitratireductor arenosus TaxID=2682096 RepID=A0A844QHY1_9HYPH|nr:ribosome maturation factor RimP [Nitratireductor arenosus]MVA98214.1 ribosome maturation factor RimP [Nitratireductor arenosus]
MTHEESAATQDDDRLIRESGVEARIAALIWPLLRSMGFRLVRVRLSGQNGLTLQIMAEREDGTMTVADCEELSRAVSPALDVEDLIDKAYHLEVSSPGIDRPLVRTADFAAWQGHLAKLETAVMVAERKRFRGRIAEAGADGIVLERDQASYGDEPRVEIPYDTIADARLILTDDLIRDALAKDKQARQAAKKLRGDQADGDNDNDNEPQT